MLRVSRFPPLVGQGSKEFKNKQAQKHTTSNVMPNLIGYPYY